MKNFIFSIFAMFVMALSVNAQTQSNYAGKSNFLDNWSVGVNGGVQTNLHDWNAPQGAVTSLMFTKQVTPVFGLSFEGQVGWNNLANWNHNGYSFNGVPVSAALSHVHNGNAVDAVGVFAYGNVNLMNLFADYKGKPRMFEIVPFAGVGYGHTFFNETYGNDLNHVLAKVGSSFDFNLGKSRAWSVNVRPAVVYNVAESGHSYGLKAQHAVFEATAGVTYHFKTSNNKHHFANVIIPDPVVKEVVKEVPVEVVKEVQIVNEVVKTVAAETKEKVIIGFAFDSAELSPEAKDALLELANKYESATVVAYSSYEDKTSANYNMRLSESRAAVIKNFLENAGVKVEKSEGLGSVNETSNRIAVVEFK